MSTLKNRGTSENLPSFASLASHESGENTEQQDPYGISSEFGKRDIGPYKHLFSIEASSINLNRTSNSLFLVHRLKYVSFFFFLLVGFLFTFNAFYKSPNSYIHLIFSGASLGNLPQLAYRA